MYLGSKRIGIPSLLFLSLFLASTRCSVAQSRTQESQAGQSSISVDTLFGSDRLDFQVLVHAPFAPGSRADFLSITSSQGGNNTTDGFDFVDVTHVGFRLYRGLGATVGLALNRVTGFNTTGGLQYSYSRRALTAIVSTSVFLNGDHDVQNVLSVNFHPRVAKNWRLYESVNVFDAFDPERGLDERRYVHSHSGAQYKRFGFGFGCDLDWYGVPESFRTNYGPVIAYTF